MAEVLKSSLKKHLKDIESEDPRQLVQRRYDKFRRMGVLESPEKIAREKKIPSHK